MKFIHLADLHLGKQVNGYSMIEDQSYVLDDILRICQEERPDAVLLCGDIYDRSVPSAEAVTLLDSFLTRLSSMDPAILVISGNHDSAERVSFASRLLEKARIFVSPVYRGQTMSVTLRDAFGEVSFYLMPFFKPAVVRALFPDLEIGTYTEAVEAAIRGMDIDPQKRNVLLAHHFVTGAARCESEEQSVGGTDNVDLSVFDGFDYVALGHLHSPQKVERETVRYAGSPLKYSFSEKDHIKSLTVVEMREKGDLSIRQIPLRFRHDLREICGTYEELTERSNYLGTAVDDYLHIILTDEEDVPDAVSRLRTIYPNLMKLDYDNQRTRAGYEKLDLDQAEDRSPLDWFRILYERQNGRPMNAEQEALSLSLIEKIWEERS